MIVAVGEGLGWVGQLRAVRGAACSHGTRRQRGGRIARRLAVSSCPLMRHIRQGIRVSGVEVSLMLVLWWEQVDEFRETRFDSRRQVCKEVFMRAQSPVGHFSRDKELCTVSGRR